MGGGLDGSGWWQASDGRWYPPESAPQPLAPPPAPAPSARAIAGPGTSKQRNWKKIGLIGGTVAGLLGMVLAPPLVAAATKSVAVVRERKAMAGTGLPSPDHEAAPAI